MAARKVRKAVIPAAGLGTRFLPASKAIPKEMFPIVDVPTIQLVVEEALAAGIDQVIVVNGRHKSAIEDHFDHDFEVEHVLRERGKQEILSELERIGDMVRLVSVRQKQALGLGHAVLCARDAVGDEPFAVMLADDLFYNPKAPGVGQLCRVYEETGAAAVAVMEVEPEQTRLYGIVAGEPDRRGWIKATDMVEKPAPEVAPSRMAIIGRYVLPPEVFGLIESTGRGVGGEIQLTDALKTLAQDAPGLYGVPIAGERYDAGDKVGYLEANLAYALKRPELERDVVALMRRLLATA
jgi:UTP--glucose-1-phosphate uridylyltransferase